MGKKEAATSLLTTKLFVPPPRPNRVPRPRLVERLEAGRGQGHRLTLISAPAGFGKTTLLSEWISQSAAPVAWLSLDPGDNTPRRFWGHAIAALQTVRPTLGRSTLSRLQGSPAPPTEALLTPLINEIAAAQSAWTLVLDDYHAITAPAIHDGLTFLLDHAPPQLHLVIASRSDPPLPLHRLRARRQLTELHAADLRFTAAEAATFLNETMGLNLAAEQVAALERRTEGWITGLQLAALSMAGRDDIAGFVEAFAGSHRYVLDYLAEEVLHRQPPTVQTFLLRTSILERLTGTLCDAVTGQEAGHATLRDLDQANLFVVPLDDERRWYRYHHLFAEVLRAFLHRTTDAEERARLHRRAAAWYDEHGEASAAFEHAVAAQDFDHAAGLIERNWLRVGHAGEMNTVLRWLEAMPAETVRQRPLLSLAYAWLLWLTGQTGAAEPHLDAADAGWDRQEAAGVADPERDRWRAGGTALRISLAGHRGQLAEVIELAQRTLALAPPDDALLRSYAHLGLAHAYRERGEYERALSYYTEGVALTRAAGNVAAANLAAFYRSHTLLLQERPEQAAAVIREALQFTEARGMDDSPACGILHVARADLARERGALQEAEAHLSCGLELSRLSGHHDFLRNALIALARLRLAQEDPAGALAAIQEAERLTPAAEMPLFAAQLAAYKARVWLAQGDLTDAARWAEAAAQRPGQDRGYTRQIEAATRTRILEAQGKPTPSPLVEPLTERETEVLHLMAAGLSNRQIAEELVIALGTVKSHLHHIYGKLGAQGRMEAAARARALDLL